MERFVDISQYLIEESISIMFLRLVSAKPLVVFALRNLFDRGSKLLLVNTFRRQRANRRQRNKQ